MAGTPRKRARREAAAAAAAAPASSTSPVAAPELAEALEAQPMRTRTRTRAREPRGVHQPRFESAADGEAAETLLALARELRPGVSVEIERTRPPWAAGYIEAYELDDGGLSELKDYLRDEHGGQKYLITVLNTKGHGVLACKITVSGPPKENGRRITREDWEPTREPSRERQAQPMAAPVGSGEVSLINTMVGLLTESQRTQMDSVKGLVDGMRQSVTELTGKIVETRSAERQSSSLAGQLSDVMESVRAVEKLRDGIVPRRSQRDDDEAPDEDELEGVLKVAKTEFVKNVVGNMMKPKKKKQPQPTAAKTSQQRPPQRQPPTHVRIVRPGMPQGEVAQAI